MIDYLKYKLFVLVQKIKNINFRKNKNQHDPFIYK
jgi:hypothetical protein